MAVLTDARAYVVAQLAGLGLAVVTDPRNARPLTAYVGPPEFDLGGVNQAVFRVQVEIRLLAAPPSNGDAEKWLLATADTVIESDGLTIVNGAAGAIAVSDQTIPTYDMLCVVQSER